ncbi:MAG: cytochrome C oxidase subunit II [Candidatus Lambdaproteobacteria bacterium]|nr:cytochrome C oxidase subunit II [Candidatus Lambdaproteobacteria bacterium]
MTTAQSDFLKGPNELHPEEPSAVGSRNSLNRDGRDEYVESRLVIDEEVEKILNHIQAKLPPEVLQDVQVMGNIKGYLHTYFNQSFQNMVNRYLTSVEDEMTKKVRDLVDKDEHRNLNRYSSREIAELINHIGGSELFNTGEVEKSMVNIMGHLQGHVQRGVSLFENLSTGLLLQHKDVGQFIRGNNAYAVVKCSFRDNYRKPDKVVDVKLAINVLDAELISPIVPHQLLSEHLIKDVIANHIQTLMEREVDEINQQLAVESKPPLTPHEAIFEKVKAIENYTDDTDGESSRRYQLLPKHFLDRVSGLAGEVNKIDFDPLAVREGVTKLLDDNHIRTRGWNTAINMLTSILDNSRMGYQYVQNFKHARKLLVQEYEENDITRLPDERYEINLQYFDSRQIKEHQVAYSQQLLEFRREITRLWEVVEQVYREEKEKAGRRDWDDLLGSTVDRDKPAKRRSWFQTGGEEEEPARARQWNEITFVQRRLTSLEEMNQTYEIVIQEYKQRFIALRRKLEDVFELGFPDHRVILEQRLNFLESQFLDFMSKVNPYHLQPGLLLEISITSIKRLRVTVKGITAVLNEFLGGISKGFVDRTASTFHRRSHVTGEVEKFDQGAAT